MTSDDGVRSGRLTQIGFIGLGEWGGPMAVALAKSGHCVRATDLSIGAIDRAVAGGCLRGNTVKACVQHAEIIMTMLPAAPHVLSVYTDHYGIINNARPGALLIDCSVNDAATAIAIGKEAHGHSMSFIDAPANGPAGPDGALNKDLSFFVGGDETNVHRARPFLSLLGKTITHMGAVGAGQRALRDN